MARPAVTTPPGELMYRLMSRSGILCLEEEELGDDQVGHVVLDGVAQEDDAVLEQAAVDVVGALAAAAALDDHRHEHRARLERRRQGR